MDNNDEKFKARPVGKKKPIRRRVSASKHRATITGEKLESGKIQRIEKELKAIYEDGNTGLIPNMKKIQKRNKHPIIKAIFSILIIGGLMAAVAWVGFFYLPSQKELANENVTFEINGPTELKIGATTTYTLRWKNKEKIKITDVVLTANYPEGFAFVESSRWPTNNGKSEWQIGDIAPGAEGEIKITGQNFGALNQEKSWRVFLTYKPENFQSELQKTTTLTTKIIESPVTISISGPEKAIVGDEVKYVMKVKNQGDWKAEKLVLKPILPTNFYTASSSPKLEKNNTWNLSFPISTSSEKNEEAELEFVLIGKFSQLETGVESSSSVKVGAVVNLPFGPDGRLYSIAESELNTEIIKSNLSLSLAINGTMTDFGSRPGETLNATLHLKNNGKESIKNVAIKTIFDAPSLKRQSALDWAKLEDVLDGNIIGEQINDKIRRGIISWSSTQMKGLTEIKSGEEINIDFRLPIRDIANFDMASIGEYVIKVQNEASYTNSSGKEDVLGGNPITITINSDLDLEVRDVSSDSNTHNLSWVLTNNFHPLKNIELTATLFGDVSFSYASPTPAGSVVYEESEKKITWSIPEMPESIDVLALPFTVTLKTVNPTQNTLISKVRVKATDTVTGQAIEFMADEVGMQ